MLPITVKFYATVHIVEAPSGLKANLWARPLDASRDKSAPAVTMNAGGDVAAIKSAVTDAISRGVSACIRFTDAWEAMDCLAEYIEARIGVPAGSGR